jgi:hypothetical protein
MADIKGKLKGRTKGALAREASKKAPNLDIQWRAMAIRNEDKKITCLVSSLQRRLTEKESADNGVVEQHWFDNVARTLHHLQEQDKKRSCYLQRMERRQGHPKHLATKYSQQVKDSLCSQTTRRSAVWTKMDIDEIIPVIAFFFL